MVFHGFPQVNGAEYEGQWKEGRFHDDGELRLADGTSYAPWQPWFAGGVVTKSQLVAGQY